MTASQFLFYNAFAKKVNSGNKFIKFTNDLNAKPFDWKTWFIFGYKLVFD